MARLWAVAFFALTFCFVSYSQTVTTSVAASDPQALTLATQAIQALTGAQPPSDVTLQAAVADTLAQTTGSSVLQAKGFNESRVSLQSSNRTEIRGVDGNGFNGGAWSGPSAVLHSSASQNLAGDASWFFPALSSTLIGAVQSKLVANYVGAEIRNGISVQHLRFQQVSTAKNASVSDLLTRLSTVEIYLDASSYLPVAETFNIHPDNDALTDIGIEIRYAKYQAVNGVQIPFEVQKYLNGGLILDINVQNVSLNTGLSDSLFSLSSAQ